MYFVRVSAVQGVSFIAGLRTAERATSSIPLNQCNVPLYSEYSGNKNRTPRSIAIWTGLPFVMSLTTIAISHRTAASAAISRDSYGAQRYDKRNIL